MVGFLSLPELLEFIRESDEEIRLSESLLDFELRQADQLHFCGWCGLGSHGRVGCPRGN